MRIPRQRRIQRSYFLLGMFWLFLMTLATPACNCGGTTPPGPTTIQFVGLTQQNFNASQDEDPQATGFQLTIKGKVENAPDGSKVTLTTNGGTPAEINLTATDFTFQRYTLVEGQNILQLKLLAPNGQAYLSDAVNVFVDSSCYQIKIDKPVNNDVFGPKQDENTETAGFQTSIDVLVNPQPETGEELELILDSGDGNPQTQKAPVFAGKATFSKITIPEGNVTITAKITDKAGNSCQDQIKVQVNTGALKVTIDSPTSTKQLCPGDDIEPQTDGFQLQVDVSTDAKDKSEARLLLDGQPFAGPSEVNGGKVSFKVTLTAINALLEHTLKVTVKDNLDNTGESSDTKVQIRTKGYDLGITSLLDGQKIPVARDEDPNTPGVQVTVRASANAPDGTEIKLMFNGAEIIQKAQNSRVNYPVTLVEGQENTLQLSAVEPTCNLTSTSSVIKVTVAEQGAPVIECKLLKGPAFDGTGSASLQATDDTDDQTPGVQNGLSCTTDAEAGQTVELDLNGQGQTKQLVDGAMNMRTAEFAGLTFQEGENKITIKVTNKNSKSTTNRYIVLIDTTAPNGINDLKAEVVDHRKASFKLTWTHPQDAGSNPSGILRYEIRWVRGDGPINDSNWSTFTDVQQSNTVGAPGQPAEVTIDKFRVGQKYTLAARALDKSGNLSTVSNNVTITADFKQQVAAAIGPDVGLFGQETKIVGDIDKDGFPDLVITNPFDSDPAKTQTGAVYIYYGRAASTGSVYPTTPDVTLYGEDSNHRIGYSLIGVGDLNNDGFDDFAVGAPFANANKGRVYIIFGGPRASITTGSIATPARVIINGEGLFGYGLASTGTGKAPDLNGDTRTDIIVSSPNEPIPNSTAKGQLYVFFGRTTYPAAPNKLILNKGDATFENLRIYNDTLTSASTFVFRPIFTDLNNDGQADLLLPSFAGSQVMVFYGPLATAGVTELKSSQATFVIQGTTGSRFGNFVSMIGDVDKDLAPDLIVIDPLRVSPQGAASGAAFLFSGQKLNQRKNMQESDAEFVYYSTNGSQITTASPAGDVDGDGYADYLIGNGLSDTPQSNAGSVHLFFGGPFANLGGGDLAAKANVTWRGSAANVALGNKSMVGGVDLNKDGFPDFVFVETGTTAKGQFYVVY
ncbi:MAG: FG-GAP repeat protein [Myxococcales bacterium]|nr:FG-GAP repeat protein [Myxococcales bacterium]